MIVLLPDEISGVEELDATFTTERLDRWTAQLRETRINVFLPKFKTTSAFELSGQLKAMGMPDAFNHADFSGMDGMKWLVIAAVLHKAFVDVNEEGTEAAAATAVTLARGAPMRIVNFRADHPFVFLIRDNVTHSILFLGRIVHPVAE